MRGQSGPYSSVQVSRCRRARRECRGHRPETTRVGQPGEVQGRNGLGDATGVTSPGVYFRSRLNFPK
jgi:hypothetical protein